MVSGALDYYSPAATERRPGLVGAIYLAMQLLGSALTIRNLMVGAVGHGLEGDGYSSFRQVRHGVPRYVALVGLWYAPRSVVTHTWPLIPS